MSFSIVVVFAALGLAGVAGLALRRPHELWLGAAPSQSWPPAAGRAGRRCARRGGVGWVLAGRARARPGAKSPRRPAG